MKKQHEILFNSFNQNRVETLSKPYSKLTRRADHRYGSNRSPDPRIWGSPGLRNVGVFSCCCLRRSVPPKAAAQPTHMVKSRRKSHIGGSGDRLEPYRWSASRGGSVSADQWVAGPGRAPDRSGRKMVGPKGPKIGLPDWAGYPLAPLGPLSLHVYAVTVGFGQTRLVLCETGCVCYMRFF